jgi:methyl-accepting chemotaxis protein
VTKIQDKITPWPRERAEVGEIAYRRTIKHLEGALLVAYKALNPATRAIAPEILETEKKKFHNVMLGRFNDDYFRQQAIIVEGLIQTTDYPEYLLGYGKYVAGLVSGLIKEGHWPDNKRDLLIASLMTSIFSEVSVVMHNYFELITRATEKERAAIEAERRHREEERIAAAAEDERLVQMISDALTKLAGGDLSCRITETPPPKGEKLVADFNGAVTRLAQTMTKVSETTTSIQTATLEIASASNDLAQRTEQQAANIQEISATLNELTSTVQQTAESALHVRNMAVETQDEATRSSEVMVQAEKAMGEIERSSRQIGQIIGAIDEITFQTNLLALNASVEAARAGEAGKGFAVVAQEVRGLAQRSAEASKEIKMLIAESEKQVVQGVRLVANTVAAQESISSRISELNSLVGGIAGSAQEQASGLNQINTAIHQMDTVTQQNAAMVEQSTAATLNLGDRSETLVGLVSQFQLEDRGRREAPARMRHAPKVEMRTTGRGGAAPSYAADVAHDDWAEF